MRILIVDDEPLALRGLELSLAEFSGVEVAGSCTSGREVCERVRRLQPDVVFLDIKMPGLDGFEVMDLLKREEFPPLVVFVTAFDEFAVRAFEANAVDYVLKPIDDTRLGRTIDKLRTALDVKTKAETANRLVSVLSEIIDAPSVESLTQLSGPSGRVGEPADARTPSASGAYPATLTIRDGGRYLRLPVSEIDAVTAERDYVSIHVGPRSHLMRETMKRMEEKLDPHKFERVHRSAIVNLSKIVEARLTQSGGHVLVLENGMELSVGRNYRRRIGQLFSANRG